MEQSVKILSIQQLTHDVLQIVVEKPANLQFKAGQAVDISINKKGWEKQLRPFTFTSLPSSDHVEFTIKIYLSHNGVTQQLHSLVQGDELIIHDVFGDIDYKGVGIFIAGGAGVTPFIAILKQLEHDHGISTNKLMFANKTKADIILEEKFHQLLGANFINVVSDEECEGCEHGYITAALIKKYMEGSNEYFYLCGPPPMMEAIEKQLASLGVDEKHIVKEGF